MIFFVDANIILYAATEDPRSESSLALIEAIRDGRAEGRCSPAVLEEVWHLELSGRLGIPGGQTERAAEMFSPLLPVTEEVFRKALTLEADADIGANDRVHVATCLVNGIETIVSADRDFDRFDEIERIDPADQEAIKRLISGSD